MSRLKIVSSSSILEFNFFADGAIYRGAVTSNGLYKMIAEYAMTERSKAFELACSMEKQGYYCIVSVERNGRRKVWAEVSSLINPVHLMRLKDSPPADA